MKRPAVVQHVRHVRATANGPDAHARYEHQILTEIDAGHPVSQRSLSAALGIALGLTNLVVRRLIRKGLIRAIRVSPNRFTYLLTPSGMAEKARMSRLFLRDSVRFYVNVRERVRENLATVSETWPEWGPGGEKRVVFCGTGEVAEIAYICLQETDLTLVAIVDDGKQRQFFRRPVHLFDDVKGLSVANASFDRVIVTTFGDTGRLTRRLTAAGVPADRVHCL